MRKTATENSVRVIAKAGVALFSWAVFSAHAVSLGELQGNALIGQPLDLIVPVHASQGDELSEGCVRADIYYGEARQKNTTHHHPSQPVAAADIRPGQ
jgi:hypothetical protein